MSPQEIVDTINEAYSNKIYQGGSRGVYVRGNSKEGIIIRMVLTDDGKNYYSLSNCFRVERIVDVKKRI